jgi:hypothetical protein
MNHPAELPNPDDPGGGGFGGGRIPFPKEMPNELPVTFVSSILSEILSVRNRLHAIENAAIVARFGGAAGFGGVIGGPNELPGPDDVIGGPRWEIPIEIPNEIPREIPEDLPAIERLIDSRVLNLREEILGQLAELKTLVTAQKG